VTTNLISTCSMKRTKTTISSENVNFPCSVWKLFLSTAVLAHNGSGTCCLRSVRVYSSVTGSRNLRAEAEVVQLYVAMWDV